MKNEMKKTLAMASNEEAQQVLADAQEWIDTHGGWRDCRDVGAAAVAEYLMNKEGKTFYTYKIGMPNPHLGEVGEARMELVLRVHTLTGKSFEVMRPLPYGWNPTEE